MIKLSEEGEIRRENLLSLVDKYGNQEKFCEAVNRAISKDDKQISPSQVSNIKTKNRALGDKLCRKIERSLGLSRFWMDENHQNASQIAESHRNYDVHSILDLENTILVPVLDNGVSMGNGEDEKGNDAIIGSLPISRKWASKRLSNANIDRLRFIPAYGDSMSPTFEDGDILLVDTSVLDVSIDGVYALKTNNRLFVKRVRMRLDGAYEVSSDNSSVKTADVLDGSHEIEIKGRIVWAWNGKKL